MQAIWGVIWKSTVGKSQTNATSATLHRLMHALWGIIWKHTVEKSLSNATNVIMQLPMPAIWGHIWKRTLGKGQTNCNVTYVPTRSSLKTSLRQNFWDICKSNFTKMLESVAGQIGKVSFRWTLFDCTLLTAARTFNFKWLEDKGELFSFSCNDELFGFHHHPFIDYPWGRKNVQTLEGN